MHLEKNNYLREQMQIFPNQENVLIWGELS